MAKMLGNALRVLLGGAIVDCEDGFDLSIEGEEIDVSCKGTGDWGDTLAGSKTWSLNINATFESGATNGFYEALASLVANEELPVEIGPHDGTEPLAGSQFLSGDAVITSTGLTGNRNEKVSWTATLSGRGPLVPGTRPA